MVGGFGDVKRSGVRNITRKHESGTDFALFQIGYEIFTETR